MDRVGLPVVPADELPPPRLGATARVRRALWTVVASLVVVSALAIALGVTASRRRDPDEIELDDVHFEVQRYQRGEAVAIELLRDNREVAATVIGSTDTLCDEPSLMLFDVDDDGDRDVYYQTCGGHGYLSYERGAFRDVDMGQPDDADAPGLSSWWAGQVRDGGWPLFIAAAMTLAAAIAIAVGLLLWALAAALVRRVRR